MDRLIVRHPSYRRAIAFSPLLLLAVLGIFCWFAYLQLRFSREAVGRTREARLAAEEVISDLKDAETAQRGFLLIGDESYLAPYIEGRRALAGDTTRLRALASKSASQQTRLRLLGEHIRQRLAIIDSTIEMRRAGDMAAAQALVGSGHGRQHMNAIRDIVRQMDAEESDSLTAQLNTEWRSAFVLLLVFSLGLIFVISFGLLVNRALLRFTTERERLLKEAKARNDLLQEQSEELAAQRDHLQDQAVELETQQVELETQNEELQVTNEELTRARHEAEHANAAKTAFLTAMSHELRTPLNAIAGYTDLIEAGIYGPVSERLLDAVRRIHINEEQLLSIINQILEYTGIKSQTQPVALRRVDVHELLGTVEAVLAPMLLAKGLEYSVVPEVEQPACVLAHPDRLRQVLVNLMGNAVKFTPAPGTIVVSCREHEDRVQIAVRDTGIGIPADQLENIFEPFVQLGNTVSAATSTGVGLGLAISRELVRGMGGELTVSSELNVGSVFVVELPSAAAAIAEAAEIEIEDTAPPANPSSAPPAPRAISASPS
ncbi:MAG TPA: CHASE3 domain-containing protein [Longimicrobiales bacterium]